MRWFVWIFRVVCHLVWWAWSLAGFLSGRPGEHPGDPEQTAAALPVPHGPLYTQDRWGVGPSRWTTRVSVIFLLKAEILFCNLIFLHSPLRLFAFHLFKICFNLYRGSFCLQGLWPLHSLQRGSGLPAVPLLWAGLPLQACDQQACQLGEVRRRISLQEERPPE